LTKKGVKGIIGTHTRPDLDVVAPVWMFRQYGDKKMKKAAFLFLKGGDEELSQITGIALIDRGRGELDHHGRNNEGGETSASLVAEKLGISKEKPIQELLGLVRRSDLQGRSEPFDAADLIKYAQRNQDLTDEEVVEIGVRIVADGIEFRRNSLRRDNAWVGKIISDFLAEKKLVPPKVQQYLETLNNPRFVRPFDLVEILVAEKARSEEEAVSFGRKLITLAYEDGVIFLRAQGEVKKAWMKQVREHLIIAASTDNPKFSPAARQAGATIAVQKNATGHHQIYFTTGLVDDPTIEAVVSVVRLEEGLVQGREIPKVDLRAPEKIEEVPEWYYAKFPAIGRQPPGRLFLNGSLTAPDVPISKIPWETLLYIVECAVRYQPLNWVRWKGERIAYYSQQKQS